MADYGEGTGILAIKSGGDTFSAQRNLESQRRRKQKRFMEKPGPSPNPNDPMLSKFRSAITQSRNNNMSPSADPEMRMLQMALKKRKMERENGS